MNSLKLSYLKTLMIDCRHVGTDMGILVLDLTDVELARFRKAIEYISTQYFITPKVLPQKLHPIQPQYNIDKKVRPVYEALIEIDKKIGTIYEAFFESKNLLLGKGYLAISNIIRAHLKDYLFGAMIAKEYFDMEFDILHTPGRFNMNRLTKHSWNTNEDLACISGFISSEQPQKDFIRFQTAGTEYHQEVVWVKDGDLYVCSLPYTKILTPKEHSNFDDVEEVIGVMFTSRRLVQE